MDEQVDEHVEHLWFEVNPNAAAPKLQAVQVDRAIGELEAHRLLRC